jgi:hypothetical protein
MGKVQKPGNSEWTWLSYKFNTSLVETEDIHEEFQPYNLHEMK